MGVMSKTFVLMNLFCAFLCMNGMDEGSLKRQSTGSVGSQEPAPKLQAAAASLKAVVPSARVGSSEKVKVDRSPFTCDECQETFKFPITRESHARWHDVKCKYKCASCDCGFKHARELRDHTATHLRQMQYQCPHCEEVKTIQQSQLKAHIAACHPGKSIFCMKIVKEDEVAGDQFVQSLEEGDGNGQDDDVVELSMSNEVAPLEESVPSDGSVLMAACARGVLAIDKDSGKKSFQGPRTEFTCADCPLSDGSLKVFKFPVTIKNHERWHASDCKHKCDPCKCGFMKKQDLDRHKEKHKI